MNIEPNMLESIINQEPFIHKQATVMGMVDLGRGSSLWPGVVARGDMGPVNIGQGVNIQDNTVLHVDSHHQIDIGAFSLVGHKAMIHGAKIGRACLIGINCMVLDDAVIGDGAQITAGCIIRGGKKIPPRALVVQKGPELKIFPGKAKPLATVMGSVEYMILALRAQQNKWGPFSAKEEQAITAMAQKIIEGLEI